MRATLRRVAPAEEEALIVTPNLGEAAVLAGHAVQTRHEMEQAAQAIGNMGPRYVVVKGGQSDGTVFDVLYDGEAFTEYVAERIETQNTQGSGCTFSAAIAAELAKGAAGFPRGSFDSAAQNDCEVGFASPYAFRPNFFSNSPKLIWIIVGRPWGQQ